MRGEELRGKAFRVLDERKVDRCEMSVVRDLGSAEKDEAALRRVAWRMAEWSRTTTMHGPSYIAEAKSRLQKFAWAAVLLACAVGMVWNLDQLLRDFVAEENWTSSVAEKRESRVPFPYITLCNFNRISHPRAETSNFSLSAAKFIFYTMGDPDRYVHLQTPTSENEEDFRDWWYRRNLTTPQMWDLLGHSCDSLFTRLNIKNDRVMDGDQFCDIGFNKSKRRIQLSIVYSAEMGRCFQISIKTNMTNPGSGNGINIVLNTRFQNYLPIATNNYLEEGFAFQLTATPAFYEGQWSTLEPGKQTRLSLRLKRRQLREGSLYQKAVTFNNAPCTKSASMDLKTFPNSYYDQNICEEDCRRVEMANRCGCLAAPNGYADLRPCSPMELLHCKKRAQNQHILQEMDDHIANCSSGCRYPCFEQVYSFTASYSRFPSQASEEELFYTRASQFLLDSARTAAARAALLRLMEHREESGISTEARATVKWIHLVPEEQKERIKANIKRGFLSVKIYMATMAVDVVETHQRINVNDLFGNVGGVVGFFMGISLLTVVQTLVFLLSWCESLCPRWRNRCCSRALKSIKPCNDKAVDDDSEVH